MDWFSLLIEYLLRWLLNRPSDNSSLALFGISLQTLMRGSGTFSAERVIIAVYFEMHFHENHTVFFNACIMRLYKCIIFSK